MRYIDLNTVVMVGRARRDPWVFRPSVGGEIEKVQISIIVRTFGRGFDGKKESHDDMHNVWCFGEDAQLCEQRVRTGSYLRVEGSLRRSKRGCYVSANSVRVLGRVTEGTASE